MPGGSREDFDGGCSYRRKHGALLGMMYFSSQNKKTEILYRYSADSAHRIWAGLPGYGIQVDIFEQTVENNSENMQEKRIKTCQEH